MKFVNVAQKEGDSDWASNTFYSVLPRKNQDITLTLKQDNNNFFYCFTAHFNSLNLTYQLMHFYIQ